MSHPEQEEIAQLRAQVAALEAERDDAEKRSKAWAQACAAAEAREKDALLSKRDEA